MLGPTRVSTFNHAKAMYKGTGEAKEDSLSNEVVAEGNDYKKKQKYAQSIWTRGNHGDCRKACGERKS